MSKENHLSKNKKEEVVEVVVDEQGKPSV